MFCECGLSIQIHFKAFVCQQLLLQILNLIIMRKKNVILWMKSICTLWEYVGVRFHVGHVMGGGILLSLVASILCNILFCPGSGSFLLWDKMKKWLIQLSRCVIISPHCWCVWVCVSVTVTDSNPMLSVTGIWECLTVHVGWDNVSSGVWKE